MTLRSADDAAALVERIDAAVDAAEDTKREALRLLAGNPWCVHTLRRRGIVVTP